MNVAHRILHDALPVDINQSRRSESCTIVKPDFRPEVVIDGMDAAGAARDLMLAAFHGRSERDTCERAAMALGVAPNTIRSILRCETKDASWRVMSRCMVFLASQGKDPLAVIGNAALTSLMKSAMGGGA